MVYHHTCFTVFHDQSAGLCSVDYVESQRWKLSKLQRLEADRRDTALLLMSSAFVCLWVIADVFIALSNFVVPLFLCLSFQPRCLSLSLKIKEKNHTWQELISQAAYSHSRWSVFFFPSKMKGQNESSDLICGARRNRAHEIAFSFRRFTLSLCISLLLFYFIYFSFDLFTSTSLRLHRALPQRPVQISSWFDPDLDYDQFPWATFTPVIFVSF